MTGKDIYNKIGLPTNDKFIMLAIPKELRFNVLPHKIYCGKAFALPFIRGLEKIKEQNLQLELKDWGGCFNIRPIRGYENKYNVLQKMQKIEESMAYLSIHSWGLAFDINVKENALGTKGKINPLLVKCFEDSGFIWGGNFKRKDPMHFELKNL